MFRAFIKPQVVRSLIVAQQSRFSTHYIRPPFTAEQLQEQRKIFRTMPTYDPKEQTIKSCDYYQLMEAIRYERTREQVDQYVKFIDTNGGKIFLDEFTRYTSTLHNPKLLLSEYATTFDKDQDGFINEEEYKFMVETLVIHDPAIKLADYKNFVQEADTNKDGKVSVVELRDWLLKG